MLEGRNNHAFPDDFVAQVFSTLDPLHGEIGFRRKRQSSRRASGDRSAWDVTLKWWSNSPPPG